MEVDTVMLHLKLLLHGKGVLCDYLFKKMEVYVT